MTDDYDHPIKSVRRFCRLQAWTAAAICLFALCFVVGGFAAGGYSILVWATVPEESAWMWGRLVGGMIGLFALHFFWTIFYLTTRPGRWLHFYALLALSKYARF